MGPNVAEDEAQGGAQVVVLAKGLRPFGIARGEKYDGETDDRDGLVLLLYSNLAIIKAVPMDEFLRGWSGHILMRRPQTSGSRWPWSMAGCLAGFTGVFLFHRKISTRPPVTGKTGTESDLRKIS